MDRPPSMMCACMWTMHEGGSALLKAYDLLLPRFSCSTHGCFLQLLAHSCIIFFSLAFFYDRHLFLPAHWLLYSYTTIRTITDHYRTVACVLCGDDSFITLYIDRTITDRAYNMKLSSLTRKFGGIILHLRNGTLSCQTTTTKL